MVHMPGVVELSWSKIATSLHMPESFLAVSAWHPHLQSELHFGGGRHPIWCSGVQTVGCHHLPPSPRISPWVIGRALTCLAKSIGSLGVGTFKSSRHQVRVSTWLECHLNHLLGLLKDSSGVEGWWDSSLHSQNSCAQYRNSCTQGSSSGGCPKSSSPDSSQELVAFRFSLMG